MASPEQRAPLVVDPRRNKMKPYHSRYWLWEEIHVYGTTVEQIAERFGLSPTTIRCYLERRDSKDSRAFGRFWEIMPQEEGC